MPENDYDREPFEPPVGRRKWRLGRLIQLNVYEGERPVCQCHTVADAKAIVTAVNRMADLEELIERQKKPKP